MKSTTLELVHVDLHRGDRGFDSSAHEDKQEVAASRWRRWHHSQTSLHGLGWCRVCDADLSEQSNRAEFKLARVEA